MSTQRARSAAALLMATILSLAACSDSPGEPPAPTSTASPTATGTSAPEETTSPTEGTDAPTPGTDEPTDPPAAVEPPDLADVLPQLTYAGAGMEPGTVEATGFVPLIIEDGGLCTFTFTSAGGTVPVTTDGVADATSTSCGRTVLAAGRLTPGTWTVTLAYSSSLYDGTSSPLEMVVS